MRTSRLPGAAAVFAGILAAGCQDLPTQDHPESRVDAPDLHTLTIIGLSQFGCAVAYKTINGDRERWRLGKLHAPYPQARDGSTREYRVLIKDSKSQEVVLTADCTLPNTPAAVSGLHRAFHLAATGRSPAAPPGSTPSLRLSPPKRPRLNEQEPIPLEGLTVVGYRESGYHDNWAANQYGWGSAGDTYYSGGSESGGEPEWWYETDEGNDELPTYCHSTGSKCKVEAPDPAQRTKLAEEIAKIRTEGICGEAKALAERFLAATPS